MDYGNLLKEFKTENDEVEKLYENDKPFVPYLHNFRLKEYPKDSPPHGKELGKGGYGKVYEFGNNEAVKYEEHKWLYPSDIQEKEISDMTLEFIGHTRKEWFDEALKILHLTGQTDINDAKNMDDKPYDPREIMTKISDISIFIPREKIECWVSNRYSVRIQGRELDVEVGDYVCAEPSNIEYLIGDFLRQNVKTIHFIPTLGFLSQGGDADEIYLERANYDFYGFFWDKNPYKYKDFDNYLFVILSHIFILRSLGISHNDLHTGNIFLKKSNIKDDYLEYSLNGVSFYFPTPDYILWIADFGQSQKFSSPKVLNYNMIHDHSPYYPGFDTKGYYDLFLILCELDKHNISDKFGKDLLEYFFGKDKSLVKDKTFVSPHECRLIPRFIDYKYPHLNLKFLMTSFEHHRKPPEKGHTIYRATTFV